MLFLKLTFIFRVLIKMAALTLVNPGSLGFTIAPVDKTSFKTYNIKKYIYKIKITYFVAKIVAA